MNNNYEKEILEVFVDDIIPNRFQPRLAFDEKALNELAISIKEHGIIQPLVVRKIADKYEIIAGERRYKAAQLVGLKKVPVIIMDLDDKESAEVAVIENTQRKDLSSLEEAESYKKLLDKGYLTQEQLATRMGKNQATISNKLRLLNLPYEVKRALLENQISERHARSLLSLNKAEEQIMFLKDIINNKLTVKQTDDKIKEYLNKNSFPNFSSEVEEFNFGPNLSTNEPKQEKIEEEKPMDLSMSEIKPMQREETINTNENMIDDKRTEFNPFLNKNVVEPVIDFGPNLPTNEISQNEIEEEITDLPMPEIKPMQTEQPQNNDENNFNIQSQNYNPDFNQNVEIIKSEPLVNYDINQMINNTTDINPIEEPKNIDEIIGIKTNEEVKKPEEVISKNKFFNDFEEQPSEEPKIEQPKTYTDELVQEFRQQTAVEEPNVLEKEELNLKDAINSVREVIKSLEANNLEIETEEFDFESLYQIIIKINKKKN